MATEGRLIVVKILRSKKIGKQKFGKVSSRKSSDLELSLAEDLTEPSDDLLSYSMLLFGEKKIGKTTLCSMFPDTQFLGCEPGHGAVRIKLNKCPDWRHFKTYVGLLEKDNECRTVVVDTVEAAYSMCFVYMCDKLGINHPQDENDYGKSWGAIRKEFESVVNRIIAMEKGSIFISHAQIRTIKRRDGTQFDTLCPMLTGQPMEVMSGIVDTIAYYGYNKGERQLVIRGDDFLMAGTRLEEHFLTKFKRRPVHSIPMGSNKQEAYDNLLAAFNNQLVDVGDVPVVAKKSVKKNRN